MAEVVEDVGEVGEVDGGLGVEVSVGPGGGGFVEVVEDDGEVGEVDAAVEVGVAGEVEDVGGGGEGGVGEVVVVDEPLGDGVERVGRSGERGSVGDGDAEGVDAVGGGVVGVALVVEEWAGGVGGAEELGVEVAVSGAVGFELLEDEAGLWATGVVGDEEAGGAPR